MLKTVQPAIQSGLLTVDHMCQTFGRKRGMTDKGCWISIADIGKLRGGAGFKQRAISVAIAEKIAVSTRKFGSRRKTPDASGVVLPAMRRGLSHSQPATGTERS